MNHYKIYSCLAALLIIGGAISVYIFAAQPLSALRPIKLTMEAKSPGYVAVARNTVAAQRVTRLSEASATKRVEGKSHRTTFGLSQNTPQATLERLDADPDIVVYKNKQYTLTATPVDPNYTSGDQWNLSRIHAPEAWDISTGSSDITIAVVDSGVLWNQSWNNTTVCTKIAPCVHPDMSASKIRQNSGEQGVTASEGSAPNCTSRGLGLDRSCNNLDDDGNGYIDDYSGWDFMGGYRGGTELCPNYYDAPAYESPDYPGYMAQDNNPQPYSCDSPTDPSLLNKNNYNGTCQAFSSACYTSHGTSVASIAAAATDNGQFIAGLDWHAKILPIRALDGYGHGDSITIASSIDYAVERGANVINLSLATFADGTCQGVDQLVEEALSRASAAGITVVAAAGNSGTSGVCYPANSQYTIAVGATNSADERASFSTYGEGLDVMAPGEDVPVLLAPAASNGQTYYSKFGNGTSFATPHVSGLAALLLSTGSFDRTEVRNLILANTDSMPGMDAKSYSNGYGYGLVNAKKLLAQENSAPEVPFTSMESPRDMVISTNLRKIDLRTMTDIGPVLETGRVVSFNQKVTVNGVLYLRTVHDSVHENRYGIAYVNLRKPPVFSSMSSARDMWLKTDLRKLDLLTLKDSGSILAKDRIIRFTTKTSYGGKVYLRTATDTSRGISQGIAIDLLATAPNYNHMESPRYMTLKRDVRKTQLSYMTSTGPVIDRGTRVYFTDKVTINNVLYLRTAYDSSPEFNRGIKYSDLY